MIKGLHINVSSILCMSLLLLVLTINMMEQNISLKQNFIRLFRKIGLYLPTSRNIMSYCKKKYEYYGAEHMLFGVFGSLNFIAPFFMWTSHSSSHFTLLITLRFIASAMCGSLILKSYWPGIARRFFPVYWNFTLLFTLPFLTSLTFILENASPEWAINMAFAVILLCALVDWLSFIILSLLGSTVGISIAYLVSDKGLHDLSIDTIYLIIYSLIFSLLIGITFLRKRENIVISRVSEVEFYSGTMAHEVKTPLCSSICVLETVLDIMSGAKALESGELLIKQQDANVMSSLMTEMKIALHKGIKVTDILLKASRRGFVNENYEQISAYHLMLNALNTYGLDAEERQVFEINLLQDFYFSANDEVSLHLVYNLIKNKITHAGRITPVEITIDNNIIRFKDFGRGVPQDKLEKIFDKFYTRSNGTGIGLAFCRFVMEDHIGGEIYAQSVEGEYLEIILVFNKSS